MGGRVIIHSNTWQGVLTMGDLRTIVTTANQMGMPDNAFVMSEPEPGMRVGWGYRIRRKTRKVRQIVISSMRVWEPPIDDEKESEDS